MLLGHGERDMIDRQENLSTLTSQQQVTALHPCQLMHAWSNPILASLPAAFACLAFEQLGLQVLQLHQHDLCHHVCVHQEMLAFLLALQVLVMCAACVPFLHQASSHSALQYMGDMV